MRNFDLISVDKTYFFRESLENNYQMACCSFFSLIIVNQQMSLGVLISLSLFNFFDVLLSIMIISFILIGEKNE